MFHPPCQSIYIDHTSRRSLKFKIPALRTYSMKNPVDVLRKKEQELAKIKKEVEALRLTARLLTDAHEAPGDPRVDLREVIDMP
jgi:hypothetical protein